MRSIVRAILFLAATVPVLSPARAEQDETLVAPREGAVTVPGAPWVLPPLTVDNLSIYILEDPAAKKLGEIITLEEGIKAGKVRVSEKTQAQVNELLIDNASPSPCYLQAGDVVKGGQQDRAIATDFIVPPKSRRVPIPSFCVEQGRWTGSGGSTFGMTTGLVVGARLRMAIQKEKDQNKVWAAVEEAKANLVKVNGLRQSTSSSLNEQMLDRAVQDRLAATLKALGKACEKKDHAVGLMTAINGKWSTADVYADPALFQKLYPRLLAAAALEAISAAPQEAKSPPPMDAANLLAEAGRLKTPAPAAGEPASKVVPEGKNTMQFRFRVENVDVHRQTLIK